MALKVQQKHKGYARYGVICDGLRGLSGLNRYATKMVRQSQQKCRQTNKSVAIAAIF
jgi:hypothetical protein